MYYYHRRFQRDPEGDVIIAERNRDPPTTAASEIASSSVAAAPPPPHQQPFATRSNYYAQQQQQQQPRDPSVILQQQRRVVVDPSSVSHHGGPDLRSILQKASNSSLLSEEEGKKSLKKVLASRMLRSQQATASSLRERLRRVTSPVKETKNEQPQQQRGSVEHQYAHPNAKPQHTRHEEQQIHDERQRVNPQYGHPNAKPTQIRHNEEEHVNERQRVKPKQTRHEEEQQINETSTVLRETEQPLVTKRPPKPEEMMTRPFMKPQSLVAQKLAQKRLEAFAAPPPPLEQEHPSLEQEHPPLPQESISQDQEEKVDDDYMAFFNLLKKEVSGQHSQLWASFQAVLTGQEIPPPRMFRPTKPFKFDAKTKKTLGTINNYLKKQGFVECVKETQLVNDKKFTKEVAHALPSLAATSSESSEPAARLQSKTSLELNRSASSEERIPRATSEPLPRRRKPMDSILSMRSHDSSSATENPSPTSTTHLEHSSSSLGLEVTLGQFESSNMPATLPSLSLKSSTSSIASQTSSTPDWTNVKLRKVTKTPVQTASTDSNTTTEASSAQEADVQEKYTKNSEKKNVTVLTEDMDVAPAKEETTTVSSIDDLVVSESSSREWTIDSLSTIPPPPPPPPPRTQISSDAVAIRIPNLFGTALVCRVIIQKDMVMVVQSELNDTLAQVMWKLPRSLIDSLSMEMATCQVKLVLEDNSSKELLFASSDDCLKFANAFYDQLSSDSNRSPPVSEVPVADAPSSMSDSLHVESLNEEEQTVLETFRRLRKSQGVEDALNQSVVTSVAETSDDVRALPSIVDAKRGPSSPVSPMSISVGHSLTRTIRQVPSVDETTIATLSEEEDQIASSYRNMLKFKIPVEMVRHRMVKEQVSARIVEAVLGSSGSGSMVDSGFGTTLSAADEEIATAYRKMLKLGIEKEGVRHKMTKDEVSVHIIDAVIGSSSSQDTQEISVVVDRKSRSSGLSFEEESVASSYRKMLKLQVPKDRVLTRMQKDGVSEKIITAVVGNQSFKSKEEKKGDGAGSSKLVSLHWTPLSGKELDNSVWRVNSKLEDMDSQPERSDISKLIELFQKKTTQSVPKDRNVAVQGSSGDGKAKLLDLTRANNVAISLKAFKDFSLGELADIIAFLDPLRKVRGERVMFLRDLLPTAPEIKAIQSFEGSDSRLLPAELWFRQIIGIDRIEAKVQVLQTMETFESEVEALCGSFRLLSQVCNQVIDSAKLPILLGMVLRIGNVMNEGTRSGGAAGFKFDSLLRLTQTKSSDGKVTVLDFLVTILVDKGQRETLELLSDIPECHNASRIVVGDLLTETRNLKDVLDKSKQELEELKIDGEGRRPKLSKAKGPHGPSDLMAAILARGDGPPRPRQGGFALREQFLAAVKEKEQSSEPKPARPAKTISENEGPPAEDRNNLNGGISRLERFIVQGDDCFAELEMTRKEALSACTELSRYCGESGGTAVSATLLGILAEFATSLDGALKKYDLKQSRSRRSRSKEDHGSFQADMTTNSTLTNTPEGKSKGTSLIMLVSDMLKDANERTKEDFKKGRIYANPSSSLKAIYEREQTTGPLAFSPSNRRKIDIVSAIEEQEGNIDQTEVQRVRFRLMQNDKQNLGVQHHVSQPVLKEQVASSNPTVRGSVDNTSGVLQACSMFEGLFQRRSIHLDNTRSTESKSLPHVVDKVPIEVSSISTSNAEPTGKCASDKPTSPAVKTEPTLGVQKVKAMFEQLSCGKSPLRNLPSKSSLKSTEIAGPAQKLAPTRVASLSPTPSHQDAIFEPTVPACERESCRNDMEGIEASLATEVSMDLPGSAYEDSGMSDHAAQNAAFASTDTPEDAQEILETTPVKSEDDTEGHGGPEKAVSGAAQKLSEARRMRAMMETLVSRSSPSSEPVTSKLSLLQNGRIEPDSKIDPGASRSRLLSSSPELASSGAFGISKPSSVERSNKSVPKEPRPCISQQSTPPRPESLTRTESYERKSISELARQKRAQKSEKLPTPGPGMPASPMRGALSDVTVQNQLSSKQPSADRSQSPLLHVNEKTLEANKSETTPNSQSRKSLPGTPSSESSVAQKARMKREQRRSTPL